jgi:hypothetical protein
VDITITREKMCSLTAPAIMDNDDILSISLAIAGFGVNANGGFYCN